MKMAKASQADLEAAMAVVEALNVAKRGLMGADSDDDYVDFDMDNGIHCKELVSYLFGLMDDGSISRVVYGMGVILDPANEAVDPDTDTIEHHPKRLEADKVRQQRDELLSALKLSLDALESITSEMTLGDRFTNAGQHAIDALPSVRAAISKVEV